MYKQKQYSSLWLYSTYSFVWIIVLILIWYLFDKKEGNLIPVFFEFLNFLIWKKIV